MAFSSITNIKRNLDRINKGLKPLPTPSSQKQVVCHPKSECPVCKDPQDTFTPSQPSELGMADPSKYPNFKPAPFPMFGRALK